MAEHFIAPLATVAKTLGDLLVEEAKFLHGVEDQIRGLKDEFNHIQRFLRNAEARNIEEDTIHEWVVEAKDIAYDAEDLIEGYVFKHGDGGCFLQALKHPYARHQLGSDILALNARIQRLKTSFLAYGVTPAMDREGASSVQQQLRRTYSFIEDEDFVGLKNDVDLLVKHLVRGDDYRVVSVTGMGGLGKTTLARKVYKHPDVKRSFSAFAWICVSQQWQTKDILQRILVKLEPGKSEEIEKKWSTEELISHLLDVQQRTKCLIVLDDIWETDAWDCIKAAFPIGQKGSKILLTTRITEVASHIGRDQGFSHEPQLLNGDESWELLQRKALQKRDIGKGHDMNELALLGKKMVGYCGGLPLAVIVLGGIVSTKNGVSEWETVHQNIKSYLWKGKRFGKSKGNLEKILGMSYYDLPCELKPCFLYLGFFPEDAEIDADNLYQLWMAEGLVVPDRGSKESIMELAELYLGELGQRGMVQLQASELKKRVESCRLHDLMRDLCLLEAERENFMSSVKYAFKGKGTGPHVLRVNPPASSGKLRRLVMTFDDEADASTYISQHKVMMKYLRMVRYEIPLEHVEKKAIKPHLSIFDDFDMLRVLSIRERGYDSRYEFKLPEAIGGLIHLRYLSTSGCRQLKLPSSLGNLKHLQTLDLSGAFLPPFAQNVFLKMTGLVCLYLPSSASQWGWGKIRLRGLDKLEILENFDDTVYETKDLIKLINLRVLKVRCWKLENLEMIAKYTECNNRLEYVGIETSCDLRVHKEKGLMVLKQLLFGSNISSLAIYRPIWKFPEYEPSMSSNILEFYIDSWGLNAEEIINTVEHFTCLRKLHISSARGKEMRFHATGFPQLFHLEVYKCGEMETWVVEEGAMPNLRSLLIYRCEKLQAIPDGLRFISSLDTLQINRMPQEFKERIQTPDGSKGEDFHKVSHVPFIKLYW